MVYTQICLMYLYANVYPHFCTCIMYIFTHMNMYGNIYNLTVGCSGRASAELEFAPLAGASAPE